MADIPGTPPEAFHRLMAERCSATGIAFEREASTEQDPERRDILLAKAAKQKTAAAYHNEQAERFAEVGGGDRRAEEGGENETHWTERLRRIATQAPDNAEED